MKLKASAALMITVTVAAGAQAQDAVRLGNLKFARCGTA